MVIYLIFSFEAFEETKETMLTDKAQLWVNADFFSTSQLGALEQQGLSIHLFSEHVNGSNDKSIIKALELIEKEYPDAEILVEYL